MNRRALALAIVVAIVLGSALVYRERHALVRYARLLGLGQTLASTGPAPPDVLTIGVDRSLDVHPISPFIYGVSAWDPALTAGSGAASVRWGGNPSSRYNWVVGDAWNAGSDWEFRDDSYVNVPGSAADRFVKLNRAAGAQSLLTIPALGWVSRSNDNSIQSIGVPSTGGPAVSADGRIAGYDPSANRAKTSVPSYPSKPRPFVFQPDPASTAVYQDEWVNHLVTLNGRAAAGGVGLYAIDNEINQWSFTHRDVHPAEVGYDEMANTFLAYSDAIKAVDPTAQVVGPESCCWADFLYSALDRGSDNFATHADRRVHDDEALIPWFLDRVREHDAATGHRSLDVLTVHWYPQGNAVYGDTSSPAIDRLRLRSTRSLWDPTYTDESWIAKPVELIPLLKGWIATHYPGTKLGITEYDFGGGAGISAALAEADVLGIFGREGVYLANYWYGPKPGTPAWFAFEMYRNFGGHGEQFGPTSVRALSALPGAVSAYASLEPGWLDLMLVNKELDSAQKVSVKLTGVGYQGQVQGYRYSAADLKAIQRLAPLSHPGGAVATELPPASVTLLRIPRRP